jgi:hypothetical protein
MTTDSCQRHPLVLLQVGLGVSILNLYLILYFHLCYLIIDGVDGVAVISAFSSDHMNSDNNDNSNNNVQLNQLKLFCCS